MSQLTGHVQRIRQWRADDRERGDVPGWVLITVMTAGLVTVLWAVAGDVLTQMFVDALNAVTGPR